MAYRYQVPYGTVFKQFYIITCLVEVRHRCSREYPVMPFDKIFISTFSHSRVEIFSFGTEWYKYRTNNKKNWKTKLYTQKALTNITVFDPNVNKYFGLKTKVEW